jgi:hypothetical protein
MADAAFDRAAIAADAVALAELHGGTGHESVLIDCLRRRLADAPGSRRVDGVGRGHTRGPLGCCEGENMHADTERIRADSILAGAEQLRAVLAQVLNIT